MIKTSIVKNQITAETLLKEKGLRCTKARILIFCEFLNRNKPLSINEFKNKKSFNDLDESSLYRNFKKLEAAGLIRAIPGSGDFHFYETTEIQHSHHHHHITCSSCKKIQCLNVCSVEKQLSKMANSVGFQVEGHRLELYGICQECVAKKL